MNFESDLDDASFDENLKKSITDALVSLLTDFVLNDADVELNIKEDKKIVHVAFIKELKGNEADKLIDAIENETFSIEFNKKMSEAPVAVLLVSISESSK